MTAARRWAAAIDIPLTAVLLGLGAGVFEVVVIGIRHFVMHRFVMAGVHVVWMAPVATALVLLAAAVPLVALAVLLPSQVPLRLPVALLALPAFFSMLSAIREIHPYAAAVLAGGVAIRLAAFVSSRPEGWRRVLRRGAPALAVLVAVVGAGNAGRLRISAASHERRAASVGVRAPNILLLILDTVRARNLGLYGYARATSPTVDSLGAQGVTFERAMAPSAWTLPSHASLFTNRTPGQLSGRWHRTFDASVLTLAEALRTRGYQTAGFSANVVYASRESGLAHGFTHYADYEVSLKQLVLSAPLVQLPVVRQLREARSAGEAARVLLRLNLARPFEPMSDRLTAREVREQFQAWLARERRPFFAFLNFFDAHDEFAPPPPYDTLFTGQPGRLDRYDQLIASIDHEIGLIIADLARRGELDRTIVAITADHGESFGEHGLYSHGNNLYLEAIHVPLVIRYPAGVPGGVRVPDPVSVQALGPTLFALAALPAPPEFASGSLAPRWGANPPPAEPVYSEVERLARGAPREPAQRGPVRSIVHGPWHYIANGDGSQELYNVQLDPAEQHNVARREPETAARLRALAFAVTSGY